ncbi:hypothetical protein A33M_1800 [Rhodovulum sp. PH10]|nr:hypothetical protein A33M_1800 [Rhodovulum sp. PH10]
MGHRSVLDREGMPFADDAAAIVHAEAVALELMRNRERATHFWSLLVRDAGCRVVAVLRFVDLDPTLADFDPALRSTMRRTVHAAGDLGATVREVRSSLLRLRSTMAQADRTLHLAAADGERLRAVASP